MPYEPRPAAPLIVRPTPTEKRDFIRTLELAVEIIRRLPESRPCVECTHFVSGKCDYWQTEVPEEARDDGCGNWEQDIPF